MEALYNNVKNNTVHTLIKKLTVLMVGSLSGFISALVSAGVIIAHHGDNNPASEGWSTTINSGSVVTGKPGAQDAGAGSCELPCAYWRVDDPSTASGSTGNYYYPVTVDQFNHTGGWSYRARVRRIQSVAGTAEAPSYSATFFLRSSAGGITREFSARLGVTAGGQVQLDVLGGGNFVIGPVADYQYIEFVFDPDRDLADVLVNGRVVLSGFAGQLQSFTSNVVYWGSGQSATTAQSFWHQLVFETNPDTDQDGLADMDERRTHGTDPYNADSDQDGASDGDEIIAQTNPLNKDSDGDGLWDGFEIQYGFSPTTPGDEGRDTDLDGLSNLLEQTMGTNPLSGDSDSDGLGDGHEVEQYGSNPADADTDGDLLNDYDEVTVHQTDPALFDTDADGASDYDEIHIHNTHALNSDSDGDGALDGQEVAQHNTDPNNADSDGDGLLDGFEIRYLLNPNQSGEHNGDDDGDGLNNLAEQLANSNPLAVDTDGDGLNDSIEVNVHGTSPDNRDTDGDGLTDSFEVTHGFAFLVAGDDKLDADNDGLSNLEEQRFGTDPRNGDHDGDGVSDGEEVNIAGSNPLRADRGKVAQYVAQELRFVAENQPLFTRIGQTSRIDLIPDDLVSQANQQATYGLVRTVEGKVPLWAVQEAWDRGWQTCKTTRTGSTQSGSFDACADWSYTPSDSLCRNGGTIDLEAQSVRCCAVIVTGHLNALASYPGCGTQGTFTLAEVEALASGNQIPDTIEVPQGLGERPTQAPPAANYTVGAQVTTDISVTADLFVAPSSTDPGQLDLQYQTVVTLHADNSSVASGDTFQVWVAHRPVAHASTMSSTWSALGFSAGYDINVGARATAEYWTINPGKAASYPHLDFQEHGTITLLDETVHRTGEFVGFSAAASDKIEFRLMNGVEPQYVPDVFEDVVFDITADVIDFSNPDVALNRLPGVTDVIPPGTGLPISIPNPAVGPPSQCPFRFSIKGFCFGLGVATNKIKNFFKPGISQEMAHLRFQLPEVNTPVSDTFNAGYAGDIINGNGFSQQPIQPERNTLLSDGTLVNTVPNGIRPLTNYTNTNPLEALFRDSSILSSDTMRFQWDIDGTYPGAASTSGLFDVTYGSSFFAITAGIFDADVVVWTGIDQTLSFTPGLVADIVFSQDVMVRLVSTDGSLHEDTATLIRSGETKTVPAHIIGSGTVAVTTPDSYLEIIQPSGGVNITATYRFRDNVFVNKTERLATVAPQLTVLKFGISGLVGGLLDTALGTVGAAASIHGPRLTLPVPSVQRVDLGGSNDPLSGTVSILNGDSSLSIIERGADADADGLPDALEQISCTGVFDSDSDDDGLSDGIEDQNRNGRLDAGETDPCNADSDSDGLQDGTERGAMVAIADPDGSGPLQGTDLSVFIPDSTPTERTDPVLSDTDGDNHDDGVDAFPVDATEWLDTDSDGVGNNADTDDDNDQMPDSFELANGLDPFNAQDASQDLDGDGVSNLQEFQQGMNVTSDDVPPVLLAPDDVVVNATGVHTVVALGVVTANDAKDGVLSAYSDHGATFTPGRHIITWRAVDGAGNTATTTQTVEVIPMASFEMAKRTGEGAIVTVAIHLNGPAVSYPVVLPYTISGSATAAQDYLPLNGQVNINAGTVAQIPVTIIQDNNIEADETITLTLQSPDNAIIGPQSSHTLTITENNIAPRVMLNLIQGDSNATTVYRDTGPVQLTAIVHDPDVNDTHHFDWSATDAALVPRQGFTSPTFTFDPAALVDGLYRVAVVVTENGVNPLSSSMDLLIRVSAHAPLLDGLQDSDGDGLSDADEGRGDGDRDHIPDYLDAQPIASLLPASDDTLIQTTAGLSLALGHTAFASQNDSAVVSMDDIATYGGDAGSPLSNVQDAQHHYPSGLIDFELTGIAVGDSAFVVIPQMAAIPDQANYRKFSAASGWSDFVLDDKNTVASAPGEPGVCPPPGHVMYEPGLQAGHYCVQLTLEDGGPNDQDNSANGVIKDPGGIAAPIAVPSVEFTALTLANPTVAAGANNVAVLRFRLNSDSAVVALNSLTLVASGSGNDATELGAVKLWLDQNADGVVDGGDTQLASGQYQVDNGTVTLVFSTLFSVPSGGSEFIVSYDVR